MKASLLLSLCLLLAILAKITTASPSTTAKDKNVNLDNTSETPDTANNSTQPPETPDTANNSTQPPETSDTANNSTQPPETSDTANNSTQPPETSDTANNSTQPPETSDTANNSTQPPETPDTANNSTQPPETSDIANNSTQPPETPDTANNSTQPPETPDTANNSTQPPETPDTANNSTQPPETPDTANNSTQPPETPDTANNSTQPPETPDTANNSTQPPETPDTANNSTQPPMTTESPGGVSSQTTSPGSQNQCTLEPCGGSASCVNLHSERLCLCSEGYYYQEPSCVKGKTFPGEITMNVPESLDLEDKTSEAYQGFHDYVVKFFEKAFETEAHSDYGQTIIIKVSFSDSPSLSARSAMRASEKPAYVSVVNMFSENTSQNENTILAAIQKAIDGKGNVTKYVRQDLCDYYGCKNNSEKCQDPLQCTCKSGLTRPGLLVPFCLPLECSRSCSAEERKQCLKNGNGPLECVCMPGYQKSTDDKCEACPFGYSGQDCKDPFQLILTIVGTIAGALILILLIALIVSASSKNKKKNVEEQKLIDEDFQNVRLQQTGFSNSGFSNSRLSNSGFNNSDFSNFRAGNSIFPKVKTGFPSQTQNPYANQRSMPHPDY